MYNGWEVMAACGLGSWKVLQGSMVGLFGLRSLCAMAEERTSCRGRSAMHSKRYAGSCRGMNAWVQCNGVKLDRVAGLSWRQ